MTSVHTFTNMSTHASCYADHGKDRCHKLIMIGVQREPHKLTRYIEDTTGLPVFPLGNIKIHKGHVQFIESQTPLAI